MDKLWRRKAKCANIVVLTDEEVEETKNAEDLRVQNIKALHKLFFPIRGDNQSFQKAMEICKECPVKTECLAYALKTSQKIGVWGHSSERTRRRIRRMRHQVFFSGDFLNPQYTEYKSDWADYWNSEDAEGIEP